MVVSAPTTDVRVVHGGLVKHKVWYWYGRLGSVGFWVVGFGMTRIEAEIVVVSFFDVSRLNIGVQKGSWCAML